MMTPTGYTFCCACAHNQGVVCDHAGKPHEYCDNHDPADYFGTATPRGCESCAALRGEVAQWKCAAEEDEAIIKQHQETINAQHLEINRLAKRVLDEEAEVARLRSAVEWALENVPSDPIKEIDFWCELRKRAGMG